MTKLYHIIGSIFVTYTPEEGLIRYIPEWSPLKIFPDVKVQKNTTGSSSGAAIKRLKKGLLGGP